MALLNTKKGLQYKHGNQLNEALRLLGKSYVPSNYFKIYDKHQEEYKANDIVPVDEKGPLIKEYKIQVFDDNGEMTAKGKEQLDGGPGAVVLDLEDAPAGLHTHPNELRRVRVGSGVGQYQAGASGMKTDFQNSTNVPGTGYFDILVTADQVRLYNSTGIKVIMDRNGHIFKKNKE